MKKSLAQPDHLALRKTALRKIGGDRLQDDFRDANRQIKKTKARLGLSNSHGVFIVANTGNSPLKPDVAYWLLSLLLRKRKEDGSPLCSAIDCILYLTDLHDLGQLGGTDLKPAIVIARDASTEYQELSDYLSNGFLRDWADFNHVPYFQTEKPRDEITDFAKTPIRRLTQLNEKPRPPYINVRFSLPALCKVCGPVFVTRRTLGPRHGT